MRTILLCLAMAIPLALVAFPQAAAGACAGLMLLLMAASVARGISPLRRRR